MGKKEKCVMCDEIQAVYCEGTDEEYNPITESTEIYNYSGWHCTKCGHFEYQDYDGDEGRITEDDLIQDSD